MTNRAGDNSNATPVGRNAVPRELTAGTASPEGTIRLGAAIGRLCEPDTVIALVGPLGAGKTQLTKGIAEGLGVTDPRKVASPTFVLEQEYAGRLTLRHVDAYRLAGPPDLWDIGIDEMCKAGGVVVVEWAERVVQALPADAVWVHLEPTGELSRRVRLTAGGPRSTKLFERLRRTVDGEQF